MTGEILLKGRGKSLLILRGAGRGRGLLLSY